MPEFTKHLPGTFSWPELATSDQQGAIAFYRALFGWDVTDIPMGPDGTYTIFKVRGLDVSAGCSLRDDEKKMGVPPHWNSYITVASADDAAKRAAELGGTVLAPPFDVFDVGRMAVLQDPTGAVFMAWEAKNNIGARLLSEPGALCWTELTTSDTDAAEKFYTAFFGWTPKHSVPGSPMPYTEFTVKGANGPSIGMMAKPPHLPPHVPSFWLPYFLVENVDASVEKAKSLGGQVHFGPQDIPNAGRFAVLADPQGAAFSVFTPQAR